MWTFLQAVLTIWKSEMRLSSGGISGTNEDEEKVLKKEKDVLLVFLESLEAVEM